MKLFSGIVKNTSIILFVNGIRALAAFVLVIITARFLGPAGLGQYSFIISFLAIFQTVSRLGLQPLIIREVAKNPQSAGRYFLNTCVLGVLSSGLMLLTMYGIIVIAHYPTEMVHSLFIIGFSLFAFTSNVMSESVFIGINQNKYVLYGILISNSFKVIVALFVLSNGGGLIHLMIILLISPYINMIINLVYLFRTIETFSFDIRWAELKSILRLTPTFVGLSISNAISTNMIVLMLSKIKGDEALGFYSAAFRIMFTFNLVLQSFRFAIQPQMASLIKESRESLKKFTKKCVKYVCTLTIPISIVFFILSEDIIRLVFSSGFDPSSTVLRIIIWSLIPYSLIVVLASVLIVNDLQRLDLKNLLISMSVSFIVGVWLVSRYSYIGAAIAHMIYMSLFGLLHLLSVRSSLFPIGLFRTVYKIALSALLMGLILWLSSQWNLMVRIPLALFFYLVLLAFFRVYTRQDIRSILHLRSNSV